VGISDSPASRISLNRLVDFLIVFDRADHQKPIVWTLRRP
jgi:hypothetical protein